MIKTLTVIFLFFIYTFNLFSISNVPEKKIKRLEKKGIYFIDLGDDWYVFGEIKKGNGQATKGDGHKEGLPIDWHINYRVDEMTDKKYVILFKSGEYYSWETEDDKIQQKLSFEVTRFIYENEVRDKICIDGHDYPGKVGYIRIDKNKALEFTSSRPCKLIDDEIKSQLETGKEILIRGSPYPDTNITTNPKPLEGYNKAKAFTDFWFETGNPLEYKP